MKTLWLSKTFWVQNLTILIGILEASEVVSLVPAEYQGHFLVMIGVMNIILRVLTSMPVTLALKKT